MTFFAGWLERQGITPQEYSRIVGVGWNTIHRRKRGELGLSRELEILMRALESAEPGTVREWIETASNPPASAS